MTDPLVRAALLAAVVFAGTWVLSVARRNAAIVDAIWGLGFGLQAWAAWSADPRPTGARLLLPLLVSAWGLRLSLYLIYRNWGEPEDPRYQAIRRRHEPFWIKSLVLVFGLQGGLQWVIALPLLLALSADPALTTWVAPGVALWALGLIAESVADWQLARFKADPAHAGQVLDRGLWRFTRHPNYFGDFLVWWGLWAVALAQGAPAWTALSPLLMTWLLLKVSGVPLLEQGLRKTRPAYAEYVRRTPAFFPGRPRP